MRETRNTRQRRTILEVLRAERSHPTAAELHEKARRKLPRLSLGTVYRNLERLVAEGHARRIESPGGPSRFDGDIEPHHHISCSRCGRIDDLPLMAACPPEVEMPAEMGYEIEGCRLELTGVCPECLRRDRDDK